MRLAFSCTACHKKEKFFFVIAHCHSLNCLIYICFMCLIFHILPKLEIKARKTEILVPPLNLWSYPKLKYNSIRGLTGTDRKSNCDSIRLSLKHGYSTVDCLEYKANTDIKIQCHQFYEQSPMYCPKIQSVRYIRVENIV